MYEKLLEGGGHYLHLDGLAEEWVRSTGFSVGPLIGTFKITGGDRTLYEDIFYNKLGAHIEESSGGVLTWAGFIWEIDLITFDKSEWTRRGKRGKRLRRSYEWLYNKVMAKYTNPISDVTGETSWYSDTRSQGRYGIREEILYLEKAQSDAEDAAQEFLELSASAAPRLVAFEEDVDEPYLEITVSGYAPFLNFLFTGTLDNSLSTIGDWIEDIFDTDIQSPTLIKGAVEGNTNAIYQAQHEDMRAWELLEDLLVLRGPSNERYYIEVSPNRVISYREWINEPIGLFWNGRFVDRAFRDLEENPRLIPPGIYRDTSALSNLAALGASDPWFQQRADFLLEVVEVDDKDRFIPRLGLYEEEEALRTFVYTEEQLEDIVDA